MFTFRKRCNCRHNYISYRGFIFSAIKMRHLFFLLLFGCSARLAICHPQHQIFTFNDTLFKRVAIKLERDKKSFNTFKNLFEAYLNPSIKGDSICGSYFNLYLSLYNNGTSLVRLIKKNTLDSVFAQIER